MLIEPGARHAEILESTCDLQLAELAARDRLEALEPLDTTATGQRFGVAVLERDDRAPIATLRVGNVKRE